jgi:hypothetical protein
MCGLLMDGKLETESLSGHPSAIQFPLAAHIVDAEMVEFRHG